MAFRWPHRNLGAGENWGRTVEAQIDDLKTRLTNTEEAATNNNRQTNAALTQLNDTVNVLQEQQEQIFDIISRLVNASSWWRAESNVLVKSAPAYTDLAVITSMVVPEGYTKAMILGVSQVELARYSTNAFREFSGGVGTTIGGQVGWLMPVNGYPQYEFDTSGNLQTTFQARTSTSSSTVRYMEGLSGGQQITVGTRVDVGAGDDAVYATATTSCQAIFFK